MPRTAKRNGRSAKPVKTARVATRVRPSRIDAVMKGAEKIGLLFEKNGRIAGRVSTDLVDQAKARTGIESDSDLLAFALASVALEDGFGETFATLEGTVDTRLDLEF